MSQFCTMCEQYFNDPQRHRYVECVYYNGCACGMKMPAPGHADKCFLLRDRKRREREAASFKGGTMLSNEKLCSMCLRKYSGDDFVHRNSECYYYFGCPKCKKKYEVPSHFNSCTGIQATPSGSYPHSYPTTFSRYPYSSAVKVLCRDCREYVVEEFLNEHKRYCPAKTSPDMVKCPLCDVRTVRSYLESHLEWCRKSMETKFSEKRVHVQGEPVLMDGRVQKGEKFVKFKEAP